MSAMIIIQSGKLLIHGPQGPEEHVSPFAREKLDDARRALEKSSWKTGEDGEEGPLFSRRALWGTKAAVTNTIPLKFEYGQRVGTRLYYLIQMSKSTGLFYFDSATAKEIRLFHRDSFQPHGVFVNPDFSLFSTKTKLDGSVHLIKMNEEGKEIQQLTDGDCIDGNPFRSGNHLYYQTSGIGRNEQGFMCLQSPVSLHRLHLKTGTIDVLAENPDHDFLLPKADQAGNLYFIQRPHQVIGEASFFSHVKDVLLFPYRLIVAILGFLDVFSRMFGQSPLKTAGTSNPVDYDIRQRLIMGRWIDIQKTSKAEGKTVAVPRDWQLIRRDPAGTEETIARNVLWFDVSEAGEVLHTNGFEIESTTRGKLWTTQELIQQVSLS